MSQLNRSIHGGFRQLGIADDDAQRAIYSRVTGEPRLSRMNVQQQNAVLDELRRLGYKPKPSAPPQGFRHDGRDDKRELSGKYLPKMRALWIALYNLGEVDDRHDDAMIAFAMGRQLPHLSDIRFVHTPGDGASVIEALKSWCGRAGVKRDSRRPCFPYEKSHGYRIARAQWAILAPGIARDDFWPVVTGFLKQSATYRDVTDAEWMAVMNYLGSLVRKYKAAQKVKK